MRARVALFVAAAGGVTLALHLPANAWATANLPGYWRWVGAVAGGPSALVAEPGSAPALAHAAVFILALGALAFAYGALVDAVPPRAPLRAQVATAAAACAVLAIAPLMLSTDVYAYVAYGRIFVVHGANPYVLPPRAFDDGMMRWAFWQDATLVYGPVWLYVSSIPTWLVAGLGPGAHVLAFRAIAIALHLGAGALIAPSGARRAAIYLCSPLCLIEFAVDAHNDVAMIVLLLAGVRAHRARRPVAALAAFVLAAMVKPFALGAAGLYVVGHLRARTPPRVLAGMIAAAAALVAIAYAPFWSGLATFHAFTHDAAATDRMNSLAELFHTRTPFVVAFLAAALLLVARARDPDRAIADLGWYALAFCATAPWFWPWYVTFALALAAATGGRTVLRVAVLLSLTVFAVYVTHALGEAAPWAAVLTRDRALLIFGPPLAVACAASSEQVAEVVRRLHRRQDRNA